MATDKTLYTKDSIESLDPLQFTRLKPQVYAGDCTYATQLLVEILSNAVDEHRLGHGDRIEISAHDDIVSVNDFGQGFIPNEFRDDGKSILEAAFSVINTSGKYREDGTYSGTSLGSFGIGAKLPTFLSHWLTVFTERDGTRETIKFVEGVFKERKIEKVDKSLHGTTVMWQASNEFFVHPEIEMPKMKKLCKTIACLCPGLTITLNNETYYSQNGLNDLVDADVKDIEIVSNRFNMKFNDGKNKLDMVLTYTSNYSFTIVPYVNTGLTESGPHITQVKTLITREFNKFFRDKKWLKEKDDNLSGDDINEGMYLVFNITTANVGYDAQIKSRITKINMTPFTSVIADELAVWCNQHEKELKTIVDKALQARKAREAAKKAREAVRNVNKSNGKGLKAKMAISDKFTDCNNKNPAQRHLMLVEGKSAAGSVIEARNVNTDAVYQLRGKIISPLKQSIDKILANQEISDIIQIIGAGFGDKFNIDNMNYDKIVITSDADSDGAAIELLLITFFYTYMRPLVEAGKLYRAVTPLYIITKGKKKEYCYTEDELKNYKELHPNEKYDLAHCKGLGEVSAEVLKEICFENQRFKRITVSDGKATKELLEILEGEAVEPRKQFIYENATTLGFNFM